MNLIERYVAEVGKHLSMNNRKDIQQEIRSTLEDMLEDRSRKAGQEASEEMLVELLKEYGNPEDVAATYLPESHLIGPQMYPIFRLVVWIALPILAAVLLITTSLGLFSAGLETGEVLKHVGKTLLEIGSALISAFGSIVLAFAVMERIPWNQKEFRKDKEAESKAWNPRDLPKLEDVEKFSVPGLTVEIIFTAITILIFNLFPHIIGFTTSLNGVIEGGNWSSVTFFPLFTDLFFSRFVPWLTAVWVLDICVNTVLLRMGSWKTITRLGNIVVQAGAIAIGFFLLATPGLLNITAEAITNAGSLDLSTAEMLATMARQGFASIVVIVMIIQGIEIVKHLYRIVTSSK